MYITVFSNFNKRPGVRLHWFKKKNFINYHTAKFDAATWHYDNEPFTNRKIEKNFYTIYRSIEF